MPRSPAVFIEPSSILRLEIPHVAELLTAQADAAERVVRQRQQRFRGRRPAVRQQRAQPSVDRRRRARRELLRHDGFNEPAEDVALAAGLDSARAVFLDERREHRIAPHQHATRARHVGRGHRPKGVGSIFAASASTQRHRQRDTRDWISIVDGSTGVDDVALDGLRSHAHHRPRRLEVRLPPRCARCDRWSRRRRPPRLLRAHAHRQRPASARRARARRDCARRIGSR